MVVVVVVVVTLCTTAAHVLLQGETEGKDQGDGGGGKRKEERGGGRRRRRGRAPISAGDQSIKRDVWNDNTKYLRDACKPKVQSNTTRALALHSKTSNLCDPIDVVPFCVVPFCVVQFYGAVYILTLYR